MVKKIFIGLFDLLLLVLALTAAMLAVRFAWLHFYRAAFPVKYESAVLLESELAGIDPALMFAVIRTESGFNPLAESYVPARGLMQITQETFDWIKYRIGDGDHVTYDDMFDPQTNIRYGAQLLRLLQNEFITTEGALCAYYMGWGTVKAWLRDSTHAGAPFLNEIPSAEARRYVNRVLHMEDTYNKLYHFNGED